MDSRVLGDYQVIKQIGQGALGTVFLAEHRFMKRQYMLKVLPEELASDRTFVQRFQAEVGILSALEHPKIVKIHNVSYAQGIYFLVSDCVVDDLGETTNLAQYLLNRSHALKEDEIMSILKQVAEALDYAHCKKIGDRNLVHRGLKLNNILVGKTKPEAQIYLCDFGLSSIVGESAVLLRTYQVVAENLGISTQLLTPKGESEKYPSPAIDSAKLAPLHASFLQSFAFLAPEQKRQDKDQVIDYRADLYSFGILAYFLLTKKLPEGLFEMPSELGLSLKYHWDSFIASCLHPNPKRRPASALAALDLARSGQSVSSSIAASVPQSEIREIHAQRAEPVQSAVVFATPEPQQQAQAQSQPQHVQLSLPLPVPEPVMAAAAIAVEAPAPIAPAPLAAAYVAPVAPKAAVYQHHHVNPQPVIEGSHFERPQVDLDPGAALIIDPAVKHYQPEKREVGDIRPISNEMRIIKGGEFLRGSTDGNRDESPRHKIYISSFALDVHPTTNEQFTRFLEVMGGEKDHQHQDLIRLKDSRIKRAAGKLSIESGYAKHPVVGVTWYGAIAYARWVGKRLPTEAEWEIAARGGLEDMLFPTGEEIEKSQANFFSADTTVVMSYAPNGYGLFDTAGNVYEWCHDWYGYNYYEMSVQEPENPKGPLQGVYRVLRGGCWKSLREDLRCSRRHRNNPGTVNSTYGFRCAADVRE